MSESLEQVGIVQTVKNKNGYDINVWNRKYSLSSSPLLSSIISSGQELLSSPMRVVGIENGKEITWQDVTNYAMDDENLDARRLCQSMQSDRFILNTSVTVESDGCMDWFVTVMPRGRSVNQVFGLEAEDKDDRILSRLWIEIPLKNDIAKFYQTIPHGGIVLDGVDMSNLGTMSQAGAVPSKTASFSFKQQVYLGNDDVGFGVFFESDENWQPKEELCAVECVNNGNEFVLRLRLLDSEPFAWLDKGNSNGMDLLPLTFRIGMMATPVKPFPANPYKQKNLHIDCFKKIPQDYEEYLFEERVEGGNLFDRMERLDVNTLYIHEKWNDIQNSPELTENSANRLKLIVEEAHRRNIKVVPYFGYEISTLSPIFGKYSPEYVSRNGERGHWYRKPWQRDILVCYKSGWQDYFVENIEKLFERYHVDGIYLDSIMNIAPCKNHLHGCGYRDANGNLKPTYPVWEIRRLMQRINQIAKKYGGFVASHSYGSFSLPTLAYSDMLWEGESIQSQMLSGAMDETPMDYLRSLYSGRNTGVIVNMLCYSNPPKWTFRQATAGALPLGVIPKPNDAETPLDEMSALWKVIDEFPIEQATWKPYFNNVAKTNNENVKVSYYESKDSCLIFIANIKKTPALNTIVVLPENILEVYDAITNEKVVIENGAITVSFNNIDYKIILAKKR